MPSDASNIKSFYKGQSIFREGQPASTAYMIKKGSVNIYRTQDNKKRILMRLGKGEIFGEMGALAGAPRTTGAEAAEYCDLMVLTQQFVKNVLDSSSKTVRHLVKVLVSRVQAAERRSGVAVDHKSTFLSICRLLEMAYLSHARTPAEEARKNPHHDKGLSKAVFSRIVKDVLLVSQMEIDRVLEQLIKLKIVEVTSVGQQKSFAEQYLRLTDSSTFFQVASNLHKELKHREMDAKLEYIDIFDLAEAVESTPEILYKKIAQGEFPESLFAFPQANVLEWAQGKDKDFFKRVKRKKKKIEELEDVGDVVFVDNATLKNVLAEMGYYKIGVLLSVADDAARDKILANLSRKIATIVQEEAERRGPVDEGEALDVQDELISTIKSQKGVAV